MAHRQDLDDALDNDDTLPFVPLHRRPEADVEVRPRERQRPVVSPTSGTLWDANDVAAYLKVSRSWVYHRAEAGLLPCIRVGGLLRFDPDAIRSSARGESPPTKRVVAFGVKSRG